MVDKVSRITYGMLMTVAGILHFKNEKGFIAIMPEIIPFKRGIVRLTGMIEVVFGLQLLTGRGVASVRKFLPAFLVAVFPANVNMLTHPKPINGKLLPKWLLVARLPLQGVLIAWARRLK